jgi:hypothetical protein
MVVASFHNSYSEFLNLLDAPWEVDYHEFVTGTVAGSPQRIGFKGDFDESPFRFLDFGFSYIGSPKREAALHPTRKHPARVLDTKRLKFNSP